MAMTGAGDMPPEEIERDFQMNTGTIAGLAISINSTAMPDRLEGLNTLFDDFASWLAVNRGHQANAAGIVFHFRRIDTGIGQGFFHGAAVFQPVSTIVVNAIIACHGLPSLRSNLVSTGGLVAQPGINTFSGITAVTHSPHNQRGTADNITGGKHPIEAGHHGLPVDVDGPPA